MSSPIYDNALIISLLRSELFPGLRRWHEKNCSINIREMIICNLYVLVVICVVSTFKIQERRKEHWWETCKFKMYQKQNNHQWLTPSFVTQWYSPPIRKSSNVLDWNLLKCILMGPADSRFRDTELGAPLVTLSPGGTMPASARLCRLLGQNDHRHCSDGRLVKSLYAIML